MSLSEFAEKRLVSMLRHGGIPKKASYSKGEVARLLAVSIRTIERMIKAGRLEAFCPNGGQYRINFPALIKFMVKNDTYERSMKEEGE